MNVVSPAPRCVLLGRPGSGKGTQGPRLAQALGTQHISVGELLRSAVARPGRMAPDVVEAVHAGELVDDGVVLSLVVEAAASGNGFVLDGFPRSLRQCEVLSCTPLLQPDVAIVLHVPRRDIFERLAIRRRADDVRQVIERRLWNHDRLAVDVERWFDWRGLLVHVDGRGPADEVFERLVDAVSDHLVIEAPSPA